jgi:hypothetical protein
MDEVSVLQRQTNVLAVAPLLADGIALVAAILLFSPLIRQLEMPSGSNALLICIAYVLFLSGVYLVRKLYPLDGMMVPDSVISSRVRGLFASLFGLVIAAVIAHQLGYFASLQVTGIGDLNEGAVAAFYAFAPGAWLGFALIYVLVLAFPVRPTLHFPAPKYAAAALFGLITHQLMLLVMAAELTTVLSPFSSFSWAILFAGLLLALFLPPRILYTARFAPPGSPLLIISIATLLLPIIYYTLQFTVHH